MVNRRNALKLAAGAALGSQFGNALASGGQETTTTAQPELSGIFLAGLTGGQEVPPVETDAQGAAVFAVNDDGDGIDYAIAVQDIEDVTMAHIHQAPLGENGEIVAWLYPEDAQEPDPIPGETDGMLATGTITEDDLVGPLEGESLEALLQAMEDGETYANVHTEENTAGEVRGQIVTVTEMVDCLGLEQQETTTTTTTEEEDTTTTTTEEETTTTTTEGEDTTTTTTEEGTTPPEEDTTTTTTEEETTTA